MAPPFDCIFFYSRTQVPINSSQIETTNAPSDIMSLLGTMSYTPDLCPVGTGIGRYGNSADPRTHVIYCIHCDMECTLPSVCCPACLLWHGLSKPVLERAPEFYPTDIKPDTRSFITFSRLTEQLRYLIWKEALPGPHVVHLRRRLLKLPYGKTSFGYESPSTIPMAYACREAYMVVLGERVHTGL